MNTFIEQVKKHRPEFDQNSLTIGIDPGETTGLAIFRGIVLAETLQLSTPLMPTAAQYLSRWIDSWCNNKDIFTTLVMEDYRVYKWKTDSHAWAELHTPQLIGAIRFWALLKDYRLKLQTAQIGKGFCTDDRLQEWGFYQRGARHSRDAIRHACHWLMFGD